MLATGAGSSRDGGEEDSELANCGSSATARTAVIRGLSTPARAMTSTGCAASAPTSSSTGKGSLQRQDAARRALRRTEALVAACPCVNQWLTFDASST